MQENASVSPATPRHISLMVHVSVWLEVFLLTTLFGVTALDIANDDFWHPSTEVVVTCLSLLPLYAIILVPIIGMYYYSRPCAVVLWVLLIASLGAAIVGADRTDAGTWLCFLLALVLQGFATAGVFMFQRKVGHQYTALGLPSLLTRWM